MNHRQKQKLARRKRTFAEIINRVPIFKTEFWSNRSKKIYDKVKNTVENRQNEKQKNKKL